MCEPETGEEQAAVKVLIKLNHHWLRNVEQQAALKQNLI